ncbi:MAG: dTDP-4-dehydrorhamnose reductase [Xanthomonadales bacterium]|nr:dTDP-4-dehydrorhamnose reductase [Xanthomonadales bacterium]NIX11769.1 dTDP-4-dehydrorhamnose reductase [Xanthomonadales bacterium]
MKILLTGAAGQLGNELYPLLAETGQVVAVDLDRRGSNAPDCREVDLGDADGLEILLNRTDPDLVVNAAAFTAVDRAEEEPEIAFRVNAGMPGRIARWAARNDRVLVHYSTDYVFDGKAVAPYRETDTASPLNTYGESKLAGERAIMASGCRGGIIRTSWVYSAHGSNFVLSMLSLAKRGLHLRVVDDQVGCPTWARNLAAATRSLIDAGPVTGRGEPDALYHYCDRDAVSWYDFAQRVFGTAVRLGLLSKAPELEPVASSGYPQVAQRPAFSVLDTSLIAARAGVTPRPLDDSLQACMAEIVPDEQ